MHLLRASTSNLLLLLLHFFNYEQVASQRIVLTNDDGWAVAQIRAEFETLSGAGYDVRSLLI